MKNIAIFASGTGSNAKKIIDYFRSSKVARVALIISNNEDAGVLNHAKYDGIPFLIVRKKELKSEESLGNILAAHHIDFIVLAGFLLLLPQWLVRNFPDQIINIHPALLPKYGGKGMYGMRVHQAVFDAKEKYSGITIHYVNEKYDEGAIIFQARCNIEKVNNPSIIQKKVQLLEHFYFPRIIEMLLSFDQTNLNV